MTTVPRETSPSRPSRGTAVPARRGVAPPGLARRRSYPQVEPGAAALVDVAVVPVRAAATVGEALRQVRARDAGLAAAGDRWVTRQDLARAAHLGLDGLRADALARPLPVVDARASEVTVRRHLAAGAALVVVRGRRGPAGAVAAAGAMAPPSLGARFAGRLSETARHALGAAARVAAEIGARAYVAGGTVRDALIARGARRDLDVVVEGDGLALARALAAALGPGAVVVEHARFLTASVTVESLGRIDVATARAERYERPGALPRVVPATIGEDLARRDFSVNAMAVDLACGVFALLDPFGGRADAARRRLRVLHPLSFVEDPTRIFRAARYAARLGFAIDAWTARAQQLALRLGPYPALSGQRLLAEIDLILGDAEPAAALRRLGAGGVFRLLDPRYRFGPATAERLDRLPARLARGREQGLRVAPAEVAVLALLADQPREVAAAALARLGFTGEPRARLEHALEAGAATAQALAGAARPSARAALLRGRSDVELAWIALVGGPAAQAAVAWFQASARDARPTLGGDDVVGLGVPRGAAVTGVLAALRDGRLDGALGSREDEAGFVRDWVQAHDAGRED